MPRLRLTAENVNRLPLAAAGQVLYLDEAGKGGKPAALPGFGLRVGTTLKAYFVEKRVDGRTVRHTIGTHGQITADEARKLAAIKLGHMTSGADLNADKRADRLAREAERAGMEAAAGFTVKALCDWYVKHQRGLGKQSATDAAGIFAKHVEPSEFAAVPAKDLTAKQATAMIRTVIEAGHKRTAAKLRAYLRAAYALAQGADTNPQAPAALVLFGVEVNPIASTAAIKNASGARDVTLTDDELGEVVRQLRARRAATHDDALAAIELSLVLGGQRLSQVLRIEASDVDLEARTVVLLDPKGRREVARRHVLPLTDAAVQLLESINKVRRADWLFGDKDTAATEDRKARGGQTHKDTVARKGTALLADVQAAEAARLGSKAPKRPKLEARDLRRTAETMLAGMGISKDVRAQLLSHGLGGVQGRHYDQHDYMAEKRNALQAWADRLQALADRKAAPSNVTELNRAA